MKRMWILLTMVCVLLCAGTAGADTVTGTGMAKGFNGDITVELTLKDGKIVAVNVDHDETPALGGMAVEKLADAIMSNNSINVDAIAGATLSSRGVLEAAKNALLSAGVDLNDYMDEVESEPEQPTEPDEDESSIPADAFTGTAVGFMGEIKVGIIFNGSKIAAVYVDHNETPALGGMAVEELTDAIVSNNSINVDVVTNATVTSKAMLAAAKNALIAAGFDPNDYMGNAGTTTTPGDPDGDGEVTISDALVILQYCAKGSVGINLEAADVTGDGEVDVKDVLCILQYEAGWGVKLQ